MIMTRIEEIKKIIAHKKAFMDTRKRYRDLEKNISYRRAIMHDTIKCINVMLFGDRIATKLHRKYAGHHKEEKMSLNDKYEAFCDWECARFTKPEKPLNGIETWRKYYSHVDMKDIINNINTL